MPLKSILRALCFETDADSQKRIKHAQNLLSYLKQSTRGNLSLFFNEKGEKIRGTISHQVRPQPKGDWTEKYLK